MSTPTLNPKHSTIPVCSDDDDTSQRSTTTAFFTACPNTSPAPLREIFHSSDTEERLAQNRRRNREHARLTRLRRKKKIQAQQDKIKELQKENEILKQSVEECRTACILLRMSEKGSTSPMSNPFLIEDGNPNGNLKTLNYDGPRYFPPKTRKLPGRDSHGSDLVVKIDGVSTVIVGGGKTHINWKTGVYTNESGIKKQLSQNDLEALRRERNRWHAKKTRDRKKAFLSHVNETIARLEEDNQKLREKLPKHNIIVSSPASTAVDPNFLSTETSKKTLGRVSPPPFFAL